MSIAFTNFHKLGITNNKFQISKWPVSPSYTFITLIKKPIFDSFFNASKYIANFLAYAHWKPTNTLQTKQSCKYYMELHLAGWFGKGQRLRTVRVEGLG